MDGPTVPCLQANGTTCFPVNTTELYIDPSPPVGPSIEGIALSSTEKATWRELPSKGAGRTCLTFMTAEYKAVTHYCH
jgi:hypothetical protein